MFSKVVLSVSLLMTVSQASAQDCAAGNLAAVQSGPVLEAVRSLIVNEPQAGHTYTTKVGTHAIAFHITNRAPNQFQLKLNGNTMNIDKICSIGRKSTLHVGPARIVFTEEGTKRFATVFNGNSVYVPKTEWTPDFIVTGPVAPGTQFGTQRPTGRN